jgi:hypothetical protein
MMWSGERVDIGSYTDKPLCLTQGEDRAGASGRGGIAGYLVTGGAGFIGSNIVAELVRRGERIVEGVDYVLCQGGLRRCGRGLERRLRKAA